MKQYIFSLGLGLLALTTVSCDDFLDQYSQDLVVAKSVTDLNELLVGDVYLRSHEVSKGMNAGVYGFVNALDDDINTTGTSQQGNIANTAWTHTLAPLYGYFTWQQDVRYNYGATNKAGDDATWKTLYARISHANNIIDIVDEMPHATKEDEALYHRVKGEAHFARAQFYLALANLYGKPYRVDSASTDLCVPLKLTPHVEHEKDKATQFERATTGQVYAQVVADLNLAVEQLTVSPQPDRFRLHRASAEAAGVLLSRTLLYMQRWAEAEQAAKRVVESPRVKLAALTDFQAGKPFLTRNNPEVLFSQGANYVAAQDKGTSLTGAPGDFCVTRELYDSYVDTDVRKQVFFSVNGLSDSISLSNKYERVTGENHISDGFLLRASEAYLNLAEAQAMQGKSAEASATLGRLQQRRITDYSPTPLSGKALVDEIRAERRRELCFEGQRWFDLRRYAVNTVQPLKKNVVHAFNAYSNSNAFLTTHTFVLPAGDPAYTFSIPLSVIEFDKVPMPNNIRPKREEVKQPKPLPTLPTDDEEDNPTPTPAP